MADMNPFGQPMDNVDEEFDVNIEELEQENLVPAGRYIGKCIEVTKGTSKAGNPMWVFTFVGLEGAAQSRDYKLHAAITPAAIWKLKETLAAMGLVAPFKKSEVLNTMVTLVIINEDYKGSPRDNLDSVEPYPGEVGKKHTAGGGIPTPGM